MNKCILVAVVLALLPTLASAKPAKHRRAKQPAQPQIACTVIGCVPVPRGCWQTPGRTWDGDPTGMDIIVCPRGRAPFR